VILSKAVCSEGSGDESIDSKDRTWEVRGKVTDALLTLKFEENLHSDTKKFPKFNIKGKFGNFNLKLLCKLKCLEISSGIKEQRIFAGIVFNSEEGVKVRCDIVRTPANMDYESSFSLQSSSSIFVDL